MDQQEHESISNMSVSTETQRLQSKPQIRPKGLPDLPPEVWDNITSSLPPGSIARLAQTSQAFNKFILAEGWKTFSSTHFPSLHPSVSPSFADTVKTLTAASRAWARKSLLATYVEPQGDIRAYPGSRRIDSWQKPRGQTIGFTPHLDVYEDVSTTSWKARDETLAFSAGAEVCIRKTRRREGNAKARWYTYRPAAAKEGIDDITALHLVRPDDVILGDKFTSKINIITGTAKGGLQLIGIPDDESSAQEPVVANFETKGLAIRSSAILGTEQPRASLLVANLGDTLLSIYPLDTKETHIKPLHQIDIDSTLFLGATKPTSGVRPAKNRVWSTTVLSPRHLAIGTGPSYQPIHIYSIRECGISPEPLRSIAIYKDDLKLAANGMNAAEKSLSSVYTVVPLAARIGDPSASGNVFLSGAYDSVVRLHDLRSDRSYEQSYHDKIDDGPIYSILARGQERFLAGTSRHSLLKVFDLRMGSKCYDTTSTSNARDQGVDSPSTPGFNVFLRPHDPASSSRGGRRRRPSRVLDSSVYTLAAASPYSPRIYAGLESQVMSVALRSTIEPHSDEAFFTAEEELDLELQALNLSMYEHDKTVKLQVQRNISEKASFSHTTIEKETTRNDWRWMDASESGRWRRGEAM